MCAAPAVGVESLILFWNFSTLTADWVMTAGAQRIGLFMVMNLTVWPIFEHQELLVREGPFTSCTSKALLVVCTTTRGYAGSVYWSLTTLAIGIGQ